MGDMDFAICNELRLEGKGCDVVIEVNDIEFKAHKNILCHCSPYFCALFKGVWANPEQQVYSIQGMSPYMMGLIINYAYTSSVAVTEDNVEEVLITADHFCVMGIVQACCRFLESHLSPDNCIGMCRFAEVYCPELKASAFRVLLHHFEKVAGAMEFLTLSLQQLVHIIQRDDLNVRKEEVVFEAVVRWINHSPEDRRVHMAMLLPKIRMALMEADYMHSVVRSHTLVKDDNECLRMIHHMNVNITNNPLARPRLPSEILLAIGGWSNGSPTNGIEAWDARSDHWVGVTINEEQPRAYHGTAYLNGFVYCIGGFDGVNYFKTVRKLNPVTHVWHQVAPMQHHRCFVSVAVLDGLIYAIGGFNGYVRQETAERYEPETNQWTDVAPMNEPRSDANAATLNGKIYICGGFTGLDYLMTAEYYNPDTDCWTLILPMHNRRSGVGVAAYGGQIYAVGGSDGVRRLKSVEAYDPQEHTWSTKPNMLIPRSNFGMGVVEGLLFVAGGYNGFTTTGAAEFYDEETGEWHEAQGMEIFRSALSCCVIKQLPNLAQYAAPR